MSRKFETKHAEVTVDQLYQKLPIFFINWTQGLAGWLTV